MAAKEKVWPTLYILLKSYSDVLLAYLPKKLQADRGLGDVQEISLDPGQC